MPRFNIPKYEWETAHKYLDQEPDGTKLPNTLRYDSKHQLVEKSKYFKNSKPYLISNSFIKINGTIYALAPNSLIGSGSFGNVKYAQTEAGGLLVMKIGDTMVDYQSEATVLADLSLSSGLNKRIDNTKSYMPISYLGQDIYQYIKNLKAPLNDAKRLDLAIELCWQVHRLHEGLDSKTQTPYAHLDLKPNNVTIDENDHVHLIDFGLTEQFPKKIGGGITDARAYVAYKTDTQKLTKEQYDVVALKRILYLPKTFYGKSGFIDIRHDLLRPDGNLLTEDQLNLYNLHPYINTETDESSPPDYSKDNTTAVALCAILIAAKLKLKIGYEQIKNNRALALVISSQYFNGNSVEIDKILADATLTNLVAGLVEINNNDLLDEYQKDNVLQQALNAAVSFEVVCALLYVKKIGLAEYYQNVIASVELAKVINALGKLQLGQHMKEVLNDKSKGSVKTILFLLDHDLQHYIQVALSNPNLATAVANINSEEVSQAVATLMQENFLPNGIIATCTNEKLAKAILILKSNSYESDKLSLQYQALVESPDKVDAVINAKQLGMNFFEINRIVLSLAVSKAINILVKANIKDEIDRVPYNEQIAQLIVKLHELNLTDCYRLALVNYSFVIDAAEILNYSFKDQITSAMLLDKSIRGLLHDLYNDSKKFQGFLILYNAGLLDKVSSKPEGLYFLETIILLKEKGFEKYFTILIENPDISYHLYKLLSRENEQTSISYYLAKVLTAIPEVNRIACIMDFITPEDLQYLGSHPREWKELKSGLTKDAADALKKLIYTDETLADKATLKNIKTTIKQTPWSFKFFETPVHINLGKNFVTVPNVVSNQVREISLASIGSKSPAAALSEVKKIGQEEAHKNKGLKNHIKHFVFNKNATEKYFDNFATEESFNRAFNTGRR